MRRLASSGCARSSASGTSRVFFTSFMSTFIQRGASGVDFGSWYSLAGSNWVMSGYAFFATFIRPAMPGSAQLE